MGTIKSSNLQRISKSVRLGLIILAFFVSQNVQNASAKSIISTDATPISEDPSELPPPQTSSKPEPTSLPLSDEIVFDEFLTLSAVINLDVNSKPQQFKVSKSSLDNNFRIAVHLLNGCEFSNEEKIQVYSKGRNFNWTCGDKKSDSEYGWRDYSVPFSQDDLEEVLITPKFQSSNAKASISTNIYKDSNDGCARDYFDCNQDPCPSKCCSQYSDSKSSRCIHMTMRRNGVPNCGRKINNDESPEVWNPEKYCSCQAICLSWNYILTSLAIAVLFIITPTAIVFALFHRRNVALERERMIRLAEAREFTRDSPVNDLPPSYDDVYDTKLPPPCFCQAVSLEDEENGNENDKCVCKNEKKEEDNSVETSLEVGEDVVNTVNNSGRSEKNDRS